MNWENINPDANLNCDVAIDNDSDIIAVDDSSSSSWNWNELRISKDCRYDIICEINIPIPAFENKSVEDLLKIFSAKEIMECKNNLTYEEEEKLKLILELSK